MSRARMTKPAGKSQNIHKGPSPGHTPPAMSTGKCVDVRKRAGTFSGTPHNLSSRGGRFCNTLTKRPGKE